MELENKKVLVVGFGKTGKAVCDFLISLNRDIKIKISESKKEQAVNEEAVLYQKRGIPFETGGHTLQWFLDADLIIPSPGVPPIPPLKEAERRGIKIISEIELAFSYLKGKIIGITGSNGKSTVTSLVHSILKDGGFKSNLAGNIGTPLISFAEKSSEDDIYVTELSSFQLEYVETFAPDVSVILNITPDHLDWHGSFSSYLLAKTKLLKNQKKDQTAILNRDDPQVWASRKQGPENIHAFSMKTKIRKGCFLQKQWIILKNKEAQKAMNIKDIPLKGIHNQENIMASILAGHVFGIPLDKMRKTIISFKGLEHRLEKVMTLKGVDFYNDSKATNVDATLKSIMSFDKKITLILGGRDKGGDFSRLKKQIKKRVKKIIVIGEAGETIIKALGKYAETEKAVSLKQAVERAFDLSKSGEAVLLAPACTSFDMFDNFEHRGKVFKDEVKNLSQKIKRAGT
ncbi:MAG: UDP-N-acetylmuramoyl-L-alanine--D-glutamate ligase [Candidatus Aminicenantes bacterium]|nr:UDP-N-acetylmuramoyl-L-alanine--D-glutamate ligase [Candidatus Aminicenantes bacterium]